MKFPAVSPEGKIWMTRRTALRLGFKGRFPDSTDERRVEHPHAGRK